MKTILTLLLFSIAITANAQQSVTNECDILITNGKIIDGTGNNWYYGNVAIKDGKIIKIGKDISLSAKKIIDATGLIVSPGFIDLHAHIESIHETPDAESHVRQGVTLALGGPDGGGPWPFGKYLDDLNKKPLGLNAAFLTGNIKNDANKDGYVSLEERNLNASKSRFASTLSFQNLCKGKLFINLSVRSVKKFDMYSGSQIGTSAGEGKRGIVYGGINPINNQPRNYIKNFDHGALGGFTTVDLSAGYKLNSMLNLGAGISNLFNTEQREFVGSPSIGRLFSVELKAHIPNTAKTKK